MSIIVSEQIKYADNSSSIPKDCQQNHTSVIVFVTATERRWSLLCDAVSLNESEDSLNSGDHRTSTNSVSGCRIDKKSAEVSRTTTGATRPSLLIDGSNPASVRGRVEPMTAELQKRLMTSRHPLIPFGSNGCTAAVGSSFQSASSSSEDDGSIRIETPTSGYGSAADVGSDDSAGVVLPPLARSPVAAGVAATDDAGVSVSRVKALSSHLNLSFGSGATQSLGERRTGAGSSSSDGIGTFSLSAPKCKLGDFNEHYEELPPLKSPPSTATRAPSPPPLRPTSRMVNGKTGIDEQSKPSEIALQRPPAAGASDESVVFRRKNLPLTSDPAVEDFLSKAETMRREFVRQSRLAQAELVTVGISTTTDKKPAPSSLLPAPVAAAAAASGSASSSAAAAAAPAAEAVIATAPRRNSALASHQSTNYPEVDSAGDLPVAESAFSAAIRKGVGCLRKSTTSDLGQRNNSSDASTPTEELPAFQLARKGSENRLGEAVGSRIERQSNSPAVSITGSLPTSGSLVSNSKPKPPAPPKLAAESTKTAAAPPVNTSVGVSVAAASLTSNQKEPPRRQNVTDKPPPPFRRTSSTASLINNPALSPTSSALMPWLTNESQHQSVPANDGLTFPLPPPSGFAESEAPSSTISAGGKQAPRPKVAPKLTTRSSSISLDQFSVDAERVVTADSTRSTSTSSCQQSFLQKATSFDQKLPPPSSSSPAAVTFVTADTDCCSPSVPLAVVPAVIPPPPIFYDGPSKPSMTSTKPTARPVANCKPIPPVPRKPLLSNYAPSNNFPTPSSRSLGAVNVTSAPADDGSSSSSNNNCKVIPLPIPPPAAYDDGRQQESATFDCQLLPPPPPFPAKIDTGDTTGKRNGGSRQATTGGHPVCDWTVDDVGDWLETIQLGKHRERFRIGGVDGRQLVELDRGKFIELGVTDVGDRMSIERQLMKLSKK